MSPGLLVVRSRPESPNALADFHHWYDDVHIPEVLALTPFRSARRLVGNDGESFVTIYEVDDVATAQAALSEAQSSGGMTRPNGVQLDPPPSVRWLTDLDPTSDPRGITT